MIAFVLNYILFIGPLIATVLPTFFAAAQFDTSQNAALMFTCLMEWPANPTKRLRTLCALEMLQGARLRTVDGRSGKLGDTLTDELRPHAAAETAFARRGSGDPCRAAAFPLVLPPDSTDGLGDSSAETHFSFTNALRTGHGRADARTARHPSPVSMRQLDHRAAPPRHRISPDGGSTLRARRHGADQLHMVGARPAPARRSPIAP